MLSGTGGDCGKTLVTLGVAAAFRRAGMKLSPFKKGPDYIDSAWLSLACGNPARNLDTWMMGAQAALGSFIKNANPEGLNLIEGNRGLHDGEDESGASSSAELAKLLRSPVVLVIPAVKVTRTAAAIALGLRMLDPQVQISGVILNRVATSRQEAVITASMKHYAGLPVLGSIPRLGEDLLPSRHLGLVTPEEHRQSLQIIDSAAGIAERYIDLPRLQSIAEDATPLEPGDGPAAAGTTADRQVKIGFFQSSAFTFYYPENLEAIDHAGAVRLAIDPAICSELPDMDGLYIGGGFPETHATQISSNATFLASVKAAAQRGLPIWAECGGLMFLCRAVHWMGNRYPMAGIFPADAVVDRKPAGHGYEEVIVDNENPFIGIGTKLRGHEFHYSRLETTESVNSVFHVSRGTGLGGGRDGLIFNRTIATYLHLHALAAPEWISGFINAAGSYARSRTCGRNSDRGESPV